MAQDLTPATHRPSPLHATDRDLRYLIADARNNRWGSMPAFGNPLADALDALVAWRSARDPDDREAAIDALRGAADDLERDNATTEPEGSKYWWCPRP